MKKGVRLSYSGANRYKTCPEKFYFAKRYKTKKINSAFFFGKAVEEGVTALLMGSTVTEAKRIFEDNLTTEDYNKEFARIIWDNPLVEFYASDYDRRLLVNEDEKFNNYAKELLGEKAKSWEEELEDVIERNKKKKRLKNGQQQFYNRVVWTCCLRRGNVMIESFEKDILPQIESVVKVKDQFLVQKEISLKNTEGDTVIGFIDYVLKLKNSSKPIIFDLKTSYARYDMHKLNSSEQLKTYVAGIGGAAGTSKAGYIVMVKKIKVNKSCDACGAKREGLAKNCKKCGKGKYTKMDFECDIQLVYKDFKEEDVDEVLEDYSQLAIAIKNNVTYKNAGNCNMFNRPCEFYEICWGKKKPEDLDYLEEKEKK